MSLQLLDRAEPFALAGAAGHDDGASVVCVVLDIAPGAWRARFGAAAAAALETTVDALCAFVRAMLLSHWPVSLDLSVLCTAPGAPFLYRSRAGARTAQIPRDVATRLRTALAEATVNAAKAAGTTATSTSTTGAHCSLTGALGRALCYALRRRQALAGAIAARSTGAVDARIVCLRVAGADDYAEYVPFMNAVFAAQRDEVTIDAVALAPPPAAPTAPLLATASAPSTPDDALPSLLSQATRMTAGVYSSSTPAALLETLLVCFYVSFSHALSHCVSFCIIVSYAFVCPFVLIRCCCCFCCHWNKHNTTQHKKLQQILSPH